MLVVDDSAVSRRMVCRAVIMSGLDVSEILEASNGQEGYLKLCQEGPDVVICDLLMPVMDGIAFLTMVQKHEVPTPIIIVSADIQSTTRQQCLQLGALAFLNKPCDQQALMELLRGVEAQRGTL